MGLILGIDTGGTYTDAVVFDNENEKILKKAKANTTPDNLGQGVTNCINDLDLGVNDDFSAIHLSSTLAINSILQKKFNNIGVVVLGKHIQGNLPVAVKYEVINAIDKRGYFVFDSDPERSRKIVKDISLLTNNIDTLLVIAYGANHRRMERRLSSILESTLGIETVCCSDMSSYTDFYERALIASTNIGLRKIIVNLIEHVNNALRGRGINVPLFFMTSDGDLIPWEDAAFDPLSTICSGPSASAIGSKLLTYEKDYLLLDMGGTSIDITKVINRKLKSTKGNIAIGQYNYDLKGLDIQSYGIGGDSEIFFNSRGDLRIGPERVIPLCKVGLNFDNLMYELQTYMLPHEYELCTVRETDCFINTGTANKDNLDDRENEILELIDKGPHSLFYISDRVGRDADALRMDQLISKGYVRCASLTPTDILHVENRFNMWDRDIAVAGAKIMAERRGCSLEQFLNEANTVITNEIVLACVKAVTHFDTEGFDITESYGAMYLIEQFLSENEGLFNTEFRIDKPIVAVGTPAGAYIGKVAEKLNAELIIPEHGEVAGAIGAAIGRVD